MRSTPGNISIDRVSSRAQGGRHGVRVHERARARAGFSLVEVVLVLVIISTIAAVALPRYNHWLMRYRLESAGRRLLADIERARARAMALSTSRTIRFKPSMNLYELVDEKGGKTKTSAYVIDLSSPPYEVRLADVNLGGDHELVINGYGEADTTGTIWLVAGNVMMKVVVDGTTVHMEPVKLVADGR